MDKKTTEHILNILRRGTITWHLRNECLNRGRYRVVVNGREIWARDCDSCGERHLQKDSDLEVDHILPIGSFSGDFNDYISRMYCPLSNLQALCFICHQRKTSGDNATIRYKRKQNELKDIPP